MTNNLIYAQIRNNDGPEIIDLFNYYILHSDAAFPEIPVENVFFEVILQVISRYPSLTVRNENGDLIGFGFLKPHNPFPGFSHTAEISYFIQPEWTGYGIGAELLQRLIEESKNYGISRILAEVSSKNDLSLHFHRKWGFCECGRFPGVGRKNGDFFDTVWMMKQI